LTTHIHAALLAARYPLARPAHRLERAIPEHERIFDAIAAGDPGKAVAAMDAHLATIAGYLAEERAGNRRASRRARKRAPVAAR
jgi:DNA-binding FadR family transcriptional regulator